ncbi:hypothetical protein M427DRAFT_151289 [Gonapodya prolifera JEL478]|uniref:Ubiquitin-like domain-containing protein n=1 Tax=Gonapodya prolifera (strain JEL478) TaxID=1344416 RepID=A0A139AX60_GONPJ|nr:hypothetical protein M427DRAFT_151289 [Gonapodya prolifera JEL478]|eukprot:KXS21163.1 hypothetical protein M427DRAFT_151289 [Gonapodya prolifera JEL478]
MGGCLSSQAADSRRLQNGGGPVTGTNRPLVPWETYVWTSEQPVTEESIRKRREEYWETAPAYEGRPEVWALLKQMVDSPNEAQALADGANLICPTGNLTEGIYDTFGNLYRIPVFCLALPKNANATSASPPVGSTSSNVELNELPGQTPTQPGEPDAATLGPLISIIARLSIGKDVKLQLPEDLTIRLFKKRVEEAMNGSLQVSKIIFLGRVLEDGKRLKDCQASIPGTKSKEKSHPLILQVFVNST